MAVITPIFLGAVADDGTGDAIRTGGTKINTNFSNLNSDKLETALTDAFIFVGNGSGIATGVAMSGEASIINTGAITLSNAAVIGKVLTGFTSGAGVVADTDTILQAFQKIDGNVSALVTGVSSVFGRSGDVASANGDYTASQITNVPAGDISAVTVQAALAELDSEKIAATLFDANTILKADSDNTPTALTVALSTFVGRGASGNISALTPAQAITVLSQATNVQTGTTYTVTASDNAKIIAISNASDITITVPENSTEALVAGFQTLIRNDGSSTITVVKEDVDILDGVTTIGPGDAMSVHLKLAGTPNTYFTLGGTPVSLVQHTFFVDTVANQDYTAFLRMNFSGTLINVTTRAIAGTCTLTTKLRDAADVVTTVTATANSVSTSRDSQAVTGLNTFVPGDDILITASANAGCTAMSITFDMVV